MRYIIYARRSSEDKKKQIQSIPDQLGWAEHKRQSRGLDILATYTDTKTGTKPGREGFNQMMEIIEASAEPLGIVCWKVNRLARNPIDEGAIKYAFMRGKIRHILASDREFREGENQIIMGVEFGSATQFSIDLGHDVKRGMRKKLEKGWRPGVAPLGYLNEPNGLKGEKRILPDPEKWDKVRALWDLLLSGEHSLASIARHADRVGLHSNRGGRLSTSSLHRLFHNPFYAGHFDWNGERHQGRHRPMVSPTEFERAQRLLTDRDKPRQRTHEHTYTGLIRCGECGGMITAEPPKLKLIKSTGEVHAYHYLRCTKKKRGPKCGQPYIQEQELERQVDELLGSIVVPGAFVRWALGELRKTQGDEDATRKQRRAQLQKELNLIEVRLETLTDKLTSGIIADTDYTASRERYAQRSEELRLAMCQCDTHGEDWLERVQSDFDFGRLARSAFQHGDRQTRREILKRLGSNRTLHDGMLHVELNKCLRAMAQVANSPIPENTRLEPAGTGSGTITKENLEGIPPVWSEALDAIRTSLTTDEPFEL